MLPFLDSNSVVALYGDLGAGKTTLVKAVCTCLQVQDDVNSPTFSLINSYLTADQRQVHHIDLYRLQSLDEALNIGIEEYLNGQELTFIEWPELVEQLLPNDTLRVRMTQIDKRRRKIVIL
jgi:tRNA threonylcarbamoyladenosine biosynthesis protein TsaE